MQIQIDRNRKQDTSDLYIPGPHPPLHIYLFNNSSSGDDGDRDLVRPGDAQYMRNFVLRQRYVDMRVYKQDRCLITARNLLMVDFNID